MYSRLLDFLLNLLLEKWFWFLSLFLTCSKAFLSSTSKACFYSRLKCTFCVSTWYLWTSTILKAVLCFQKYIQSCLFYAVTAVVHLWVFFFLLCKILLLKFWPRKKIQQRTQKVFNWRLYPTSLWRGSACRLSLLEKVAGGWREEGKKSPEHASLGCLAALLTPLHSAHVPVIGQERLSWEMPVLSEQMSCCRLLDRAELLALAVLAAWQG